LGKVHSGRNPDSEGGKRRTSCRKGKTRPNSIYKKNGKRGNKIKILATGKINFEQEKELE